MRSHPICGFSKTKRCIFLRCQTPYVDYESPLPVVLSFKFWINRLLRLHFLFGRFQTPGKDLVFFGTWGLTPLVYCYVTGCWKSKLLGLEPPLKVIFLNLFFLGLSLIICILINLVRKVYNALVEVRLFLY